MRNFSFVLLIVAVLLVVTAISVPCAQAQSISAVQPRSIRVGETTRITVTGKNLHGPLRVRSSVDAEIQVESAEAEKATFTVSVPSETSLGPIGIWIASQAGPIDPIALLVDDLPTIDDNGDNHSIETAQSITPLTTVDGVSDGSKSDFYRFRADKDQRIAFEVLTQDIHSAMDPVVRLLTESGETLLLCDDDEVGPECRFSYTFAASGDYLIEVRDNRFVAGGNYHLRAGDFPLVRHAFPMAVARGSTTAVDMVPIDGTAPATTTVTIAEDFADATTTIASRFENGASSSWTRLAVRDSAQFVEQDSSLETLTLPTDINGQLTSEHQVDQYNLRGEKDATFRFIGRTRSLGSRALLKMQLLRADGSVVAQTPIDDSDEWSFVYRFLDDAEYRLTVTDLLDRGGDGFGYLVEVDRMPTFAFSLKPDAKTPERFVIEENHGACAIDLQIDRVGYDGVIDLAIESTGLRILNPVIPSKAKTAKIFITTTGDWTSDSAEVIRIAGTARDNPNVQAVLTSVSLHRTKRPHVLFPAQWQDGALFTAGAETTDAYYSISPSAPLQFAAGANEHIAKFQLNRINADFKAPVTLMRQLASPGWTLSEKVEKDVHTVTFRHGRLTEPPETLSIAVYCEFLGRGRMSITEFPVQWIDPVRVELSTDDALVAGQVHEVVGVVHRAGDDPQPAKFQLGPYPEGWSGPESVSIAADESVVRFRINVGPEPKSGHETPYMISGNYHGTTFTNSDRWSLPPVIAPPAKLEVYPTEIVFSSNDARRHLIVTGWDPTGTPRDWTRDVTFESSNPEIAFVDAGAGVVYAKSEGEATVMIRVGDHEQSVPVHVEPSKSEKLIGFESEVLVALSKQGCNSGACHGSPSGKGMFRLSLRAFDKKLDELTLIREDFGRRVNRIEPEKSLLLLKPTMQVGHGGGKQLRESDAAYTILNDWIAQGARPDPPDTARCVRLEVFPSDKRIMSLTGGRQQLAVLAHFSDGTYRDVTHLVAYESSNISVATVDENGLVTPQTRGESAILVRFLEHIESVPVMFLDKNPSFQFTAEPPNNYIDEFVNAKLRQLQYLPSELCNDAEFIRRVYLDVIGILPTVEETQSFLDDNRSDKRTRLIDELLEREEFARFWALKWGDLLKMTGKMVGDEGVHKYHRWVEEAFRTNMPYDEFARALIAAEGSTLANPPANFYRTSADMNDCVETVSQVFLGARLQCAKCHNHPFERWTQDNYYGLGAFFHRLQRRKTQRPGEMFIYTSGNGEVTQPRTGESMKPWLPAVGEIEVTGDADRREILVDWLVQRDNPYFARIEANRIWSECFSRGIVDPIDDFRDSNPPSNGPLLDALATDFAEHGFDRKRLLRTILNSRTYQSSYEANDTNHQDTAYFSHQRPRMLSAEQLLDAVNHTTGLSQSYGNLPPGTKATQLPAPDLVNIDFLKVFGQPERSTVCACERVDNTNLGMAIELFNGSTIHKKLRDPNNRFRKAISEGKSVEEAVKELYLAALCRLPTDVEIKTALDHCVKRGSDADGLEDVCWALMNTDEFLFQH